jgi:hypothetical protein
VPAGPRAGNAAAGLFAVRQTLAIFATGRLIAMDRIWRGMLIVPLLAALAGSSHAAGPSNVRLHYITPDAAYDAVKNTPGLDSVTLALKGGVILLQGTEDGIGEAKSRLALIDVPQTELSIVATLVQFERQPDGSVRERTC